MSNRELVRAFSAAWSAAPGGLVPDGVVSRLIVLCAEARSSHPDIEIDEGELVAAVARRCPAGVAAQDFVDRCRSGDLALAIAAGRGQSAAIQAIERLHRGTFEHACRRFVSSSRSIHDLLQILREKLFVGAQGGHPKILDYAGQGLLDNWLRVTAVRTFLDVVKRKDRERELLIDDTRMQPVADPSDLALDVIKHEYRAAVADAIDEAARRLNPADRQLLRMHLVAGLTIDQLGASLGIHRATAARRIARGRDQLVASTREILAHRMRLAPEELDGVLGLVMSRIDLSLSKLLASRTTEGGA